MAYIELVIKIDDKTYNNFVRNKYSKTDVIVIHSSLINSIPLIKGHGRIGDLDALREEVSSWGMNDYEPSDFIDAIDQADTIIEADIPTMYYPQVEGITPTIIEADKEEV